MIGMPSGSGEDKRRTERKKEVTNNDNGPERVHIYSRESNPGDQEREGNFLSEAGGQAGRDEKK